jgi:intraflagellar transport protein 80
MIKLCNKTGWTYSFNKIESGSLFKLSWSSDGTSLAGAGVIYLFNLKRETIQSYLEVLLIELFYGKILK